MKKIRRNAVFLILIGVLSVSAIFYYEYMGKNSKGQIYYNDELIAKEGDSYTYFSREGSIEQLTFKRFSGVETVYVSRDDQTLHLDLYYGVDFGNFKVVIVRQDNEVIVIENTTKYDTEMQAGDKIKIVGDNTSGELRLILSENK